MANTYYTSGCGSTASTSVIWRAWCSGSSTTSAITLDDVYWAAWNGITSTSTGDSIWLSWNNASNSFVYPVETREQAEERQAAEEVQRAELQAQADALRRKQQQAAERAEQCLVEHLDQEQRKSWRDKGHFVVHGRSGLRYRVRKYAVGNIDVVDRNGRIRERLCIHSTSIPACDNLLAQKLHLENDEDYVMRIANKHPPLLNDQVLPTLQ